MNAKTQPHTDASSPAQPLSIEPMFSPFEWGSDAARDHPDYEKVAALRFVGIAMDLARGVGLILLSIASLGLLADEASTRLEYADNMAAERAV